jgi:phosphoribosylamine--glycine ligase
MRVLVVGSGGREHTLVWKISQSPEVSGIFCAPGNAGIAEQATCVDIKATDIHNLLAFAQENKIDLTVVGPELPLTIGIVDLFEANGLKIVGPRKAAAEIEGSKAYAKELMYKYGIPTADFRIFTSVNEAIRYVKDKGLPIVVKADGLAAGKGVAPAKTLDEAIYALDLIMVQKAFGDAGNRVVIEEYLEGEEASFLAFTDGQTVVALPTSQDHKPIYDGDEGPNTGGMGAYSPAPVITGSLCTEIMNGIMVPAVKGMATEGKTYKGILYAGLAIVDGRPYVLEFNARMGDPEAQPLLTRMKSDLIPVLKAITDERLSEVSIEYHDKPSVCVVMASKGYPGNYEKGRGIKGLESVVGLKDVFIFHAGTAFEDGRIVTSGGRVLGVTAMGENIEEAISRAYKAVERITWEGVYFRTDIGKKALRYKTKA